MSKKAKIELTPEELAEKKIRRSNGWTRFWAIVLALALTAGVFSYAKSQGSKVAEETETTTSSNVKTGSAANANSSSGWDDGSDSSSSSSDSSSSSGDSSSSSSDGSSDSSSSSNAEAAASVINAATAKAASAGYTWARKCVIENVDVGDKTETLNNIIHRVDDSADLNSVVGNFLGKGDKTETIAKGADATEVTGNENYPLKATSLKADDLKNLTVDGGTYTFTLEDATDPQKDESTSLSRLTNDFITQDEVSTGISDALGILSSLISVKSSTVVFKDIKVTVVVNNGQLESFKYSYYMDVQKLELSVATGTGYGTVEGSYTDFAY